MRQSFLLLVCGLLLAASLGAQPVTIGEHVKERFATPHPYPAGDGKVAALVWSDEIFFDGAIYIAPHFARFELAPDDRVVIRSRDGAQTWTHTGLGKSDLGTSEHGFFAVHIKGVR